MSALCQAFAAAGLGRRARVVRLLGGVRGVWQAPETDCYILLGVSRTATAPEIKAAYLGKAKAVHPDMGAGNASGSDAMVQLNLCYEALTRRRKEYDAAKGHFRTRGSPEFGAGRGAWWGSSHRQRSEDVFDEFNVDFEEAFQRWAQNEEAFHGSSKRAKRNRNRKQQTRGDAWKEWADDWRRESESPRWQRRAAEAEHQGPRWMDDDSEDESSDDEWLNPGRRPNRKAPRKESHRDFDDNFEDEGRRPPKGKGKGKSSSKRSQGDFAEGEFDTNGRPLRKSSAKDESPQEVCVAVPGGRSSNWEGLTGTYTLREKAFNSRSAYAKMGSRPHFLFWSHAFGDWKLSERLDDDGNCIGFAEDPEGKKPPWASRGVKWRLWDPSARRFVQRRVTMEPPSAEEEPTADNDEVPWSRPSLDTWPTADLLRWCVKRGVSTRGCFDRESLVERVTEFVDAASSDSGQSGRQGSRSRTPTSDDSDSDSDEFNDGAPPNRANSRGRRRSADDAGVPVQLASRMKTDGSYTRRPALDPEVTFFGNRIERFGGEEEDVLSWLESGHGDKSRLYAVYIDGEFRYSLVWKKAKYWGRVRPKGGTSKKGGHQWQR